MLFEPSPLSSTRLSVPLHTFAPKPAGLQVGSLGNGGDRTWGPIQRAARELSKGTSTHIQYISPPAGVSVYTKQIHPVFCAAAGNPSGPLLPPDRDETAGGKAASLHTPPPSAQLDSAVKWGLAGNPG